MLLTEINKLRYDDLAFGNDKKLYVVTKDKKRHGPFSSDESADLFIRGRKDLVSPTKEWF